jgi:hypothetical protein
MTEREGPPPDLGEVLASLPSGATINVHRWRTDGPRPRYAYVGRIEAADFSPDLIAQRWGGGDYRLYIRVPEAEAKAAGVPQLVVRDLAIDPAAGGGPPAATPAPANFDVPAGVAQLIQLQGEMMRTALEGLRATRESPAEMIRTVAELVRGQQSADPMRDLVLELVRARLSGAPQWADLWEVFERGMQAAQEWRTSGDSSALERLGLRFAELLERMGRPAGGSAPAAPGAPAPALASAAPAPQTVGMAPSATMPAWRRWIEGLRPMILEAARLNGPADLYADLLAEHLPAELDGEVNALLAGPWPDNVLGTLGPEWRPALPWLRRVLVAFADRATEPEPEPEPEPGPEP